MGKLQFLIVLLCVFAMENSLASLALELSNIKFKKAKGLTTIYLKFAGPLQERPHFHKEGKVYQITIPNGSTKLANQQSGSKEFEFIKDGQNLLIKWNCTQVGGCSSAQDNNDKGIGDYEYKFNGNELKLIYPVASNPNSLSMANQKVVSTETTQNSFLLSAPKREVIKKNEVTMFSSPTTPKSSKIPSIDVSSIQGQMVKIALILMCLVAFIILAAKFFKKFVTGKNKLGFLKSTQVVEVLNTTYIGPKRQLILVRAHEQVVLIASHESGVEFLCEVNDLATLLKHKEREATGNNFDTTILAGLQIPNLEEKIKLKDPNQIYQSKNERNANANANAIANTSTKTKSITSLIKNRIQDLKAMQ